MKSFFRFVQIRFIKFLLFIMLFPLSSQAFKFTEEVCREYGLGKNWYCEIDKDKDQNKNKENEFELNITAEDILNSRLAPEEQTIVLNELWELQRKRAVITGDKKILEQFLTTHYLIADRGMKFAKNIQNFIEAMPQFASSESYFKNIAEQTAQEEEHQRTLREQAKNYGIVFIYDSNCQYCAKQLPILQSFRNNYHYKIIGISADGNYFSGLNENITDSMVTDDPLVKAFPTILLLDKKQPKKIFIAKGLTSQAELEERIVHRIREREDEKKNSKHN